MRARVPGLGKRLVWRRPFSSSAPRRELRNVAELPDAIRPSYKESSWYDLLSLRWPSPPRNILLIKKDNTPSVTESFVVYAKHIQETYPTTSIILERAVAEELRHSFEFPVYTDLSGVTSVSTSAYAGKTDVVSTLGGDGTILHASSLFAASEWVPPMLSFSMGTLGFLGEWKFDEYKRAFREVYMSGADVAIDRLRDQPEKSEAEQSLLSASGWSSMRGKSMGKARTSKVLLRDRLCISVFDPSGTQVPSKSTDGNKGAAGGTYAMNEVILHRGADPHLVDVEVFVDGRFLTEAVADGMIISTPTGSTAYSLSSGGSIVHPLVPATLLTPICPRSLSFRPLVLPGNTPITLRLSEKNRGRKVEMSIDGVRRDEGLGVGMEVRVQGEEVRDRQGNFHGGVPSIVRRPSDDAGGDEGWVGGLLHLLKFNYPFQSSS